MADVLGGFTAAPFTAGDITHDVYRAGTGPAVVVIAEIPGITPKVAAFARRVMDLGCSVALPHLFGTPGRAPSAAYAAQSLLHVCVSKEFCCLALGQIGPVSDWLRALARSEHVRGGGPGIGVVGMCFTGNYALAMAVDDIVIAPVLSQPSLPFPFGGPRKADPAVSHADLTTIRARTEGDGTRILGLRFTGDRTCPAGRFQRLRDELGDRFVSVELDSSKGNPFGHPATAHSVLTEHLDDRDGTPTRAAVDQVLALFKNRLLPAEQTGT
ncbi:MAG: dienelactone hydrolase family protein [Actinomycetota bacterium]|nr:dienelactone hydrolase family protein [Actinomycetota bacterium]